LTLLLDLPPELETRLQAESARHGLPVQEYALKALVIGLEAEASSPGVGPMPQTGADALAYWESEGALGIFADRPDTPEFARELRRQAEQ
jgi:hypothetical protein